MRIPLITLFVAPLFIYTPHTFAVLNTMAETGFTGILRIPNANALPFGDFSINYQWEENIDEDTCYSCGAHKTILMGVGLLPGFEFSVQNTHKLFSDGPGFSSTHASDLSFSAKYDFKPFLPEQWLSLAVGVQDYGGASNHHKNTYAVASKVLFSQTPYQFRFSAGYGQGDVNNQMGADYLQGPFMGIEWQPFSWLQLVAEHDGTGINGGLKLFSSDQWLPSGWKANMTYQLYSDSLTDNRDNQWIGLGLTVPLVIGESVARYSVTGVDDFAFQEPPEALKKAKVIEEMASGHASGSDLVATLPSVEHLSQGKSQHNELQRLQSLLVQYGFENVRVGLANERIVVSLENNLFNWNELDGIGVALGIIVNNSDAPSFQLQLLNNQIIVLNIIGKSDQYSAFLNQEVGSERQNPGLTVTEQSMAGNTAIEWLSERQASSHFVPRVIFSPHLRSALGTELGVFDYSLALSSNVQLSLWKGGVVDVRYLLPITHSDSYDDGEYFANSRHESELDRILFHQAFRLSAGITTQFSGGQVYKDYAGVLNETLWQSPLGAHRVKTEMAHFEKQESDYRYQPLLISYRYLASSLDMSIEATYGQYWAGDLGGSVSIKQWFGDMAVKLTYQNSTCNQDKATYSCAYDGFSENHEYAGLNFIFPFGPRKNASPAIGIQLKTLEQWAYGYRSRINNFANYIGGSRASSSNLQYNIDQQYYNRDRLSSRYIQLHYQRLRDSYRIFKR